MAYVEGQKITLYKEVRVYADAANCRALNDHFSFKHGPADVYVAPEHLASQEPAVCVRTGIYPSGMQLGWININENVANTVTVYDEQGNARTGELYIADENGTMHRAKEVYIADYDGRLNRAI